MDPVLAKASYLQVSNGNKALRIYFRNFRNIFQRETHWKPNHLKKVLWILNSGITLWDQEAVKQTSLPTLILKEKNSLMEI